MATASLWVAAGGALGSVLRYWVAEAFARAGAVAFPWATLFANVTGSFLLGAIAALAAAEGRFPLGQEARLFLTVGVCGGYTTFSTFSLQTVELARAGALAPAALNALLSLAACLLAAWLGGLAGAVLRGGGGG